MSERDALTCPHCHRPFAEARDARRDPDDAALARQLVDEWKLSKRPLFGPLDYDLAAYVVGRMRQELAKK